MGIGSFAFFIALAGASSAVAAEPAARNVIVFLGDAGGIPTLNAASIHGYKEPGRLFVHKMPRIALSETSSASSWVTDSAAGMTAIVSGQKTNNGVISQSAAAVRGKRDGEPLKTVLEYAEEHGLSTGVVSNSSVLSATPAACYAHVNDRKNVAEIFRQLVAPRFGNGVDVVIGAGRKEVLQAAQQAGLDARAALEKAGLGWYESLAAVPAAARRAAVLFEDGGFDLDAATQRAIDILSRNPKGFFLMVESDLHTESVFEGLQSAVAFDVAIRRAATRLVRANTLVLFAADHSYDFRLHDGDRDKPLFLESEKATRTDGVDSIRFKNVRRDDDHTGEEVLVAAQGPGAARVQGVISNTALFHIMMAAYGWKSDPPGPPAQAKSRPSGPAPMLEGVERP